MNIFSLRFIKLLQILIYIKFLPNEYKNILETFQENWLRMEIFWKASFKERDYIENTLTHEYPSLGKKASPAFYLLSFFLF